MVQEVSRLYMTVTEKSGSLELQSIIIVKSEAMSKNAHPFLTYTYKVLEYVLVSSATDQMQVAKALRLLWRSAHWN